MTVAVKGTGKRSISTIDTVAADRFPAIADIVPVAALGCSLGQVDIIHQLVVTGEVEIDHIQILYRPDLGHGWFFLRENCKRESARQQ